MQLLDFFVAFTTVATGGHVDAVKSKISYIKHHSEIYLYVLRAEK